MVSTAFQNSNFRTFQDFSGHFSIFSRTLESKFQDISGHNQKKREIFRTFQDKTSRLSKAGENKVNGIWYHAWYSLSDQIAIPMPIIIYVYLAHDNLLLSDNQRPWLNIFKQNESAPQAIIFVISSHNIGKSIISFMENTNFRTFQDTFRKKVKISGHFRTFQDKN